MSPLRHLLAQHERLAVALVSTVAGAFSIGAATAVYAAGGPYVVDDFEVTPGEAKVETWASFGDNADALYVVNPSYTLDALHGIELSAQLTRSHEDDDWGTALAPKIKATILSLDRYGVGVGFIMTGAYNLRTDRTETYAAIVPLTVEPIKNVRININLGWEHDQEAEKDLMVWGVGSDWQIRENLALIGEVFGRNEGRTGFQLGLRPTVLDDKIDLHLVAGRNITDATANWITVGLTLRF